MSIRTASRRWSALGAATLALAGALLIARTEWFNLRESFETDARIAHRLLSQRVVQNDAVLATLALLQPAPGADHPEQGLSRVYPRILRVVQRKAGTPWTDNDAPPQHPPLPEPVAGDGQAATPPQTPSLSVPSAARAAAEALSRQTGRAVLSAADATLGRYELVMAAGDRAYAMLLDARQTVPWDEWPIAPDRRPEQVTLTFGDATWVVQPGEPPGRWALHFSKVLASDSQPFELRIERALHPSDLPVWPMLAWVGLCAAVGWAVNAWQRQAAARHRAEEWLRLGQVARLDTLGELAAGMAHELNQPLTAVLASTQAAARLLAEDPPDNALARQAMERAAQQARRAADVVGRLRRLVERPQAATRRVPVDPTQAAREALALLEPECRRRYIQVQLDAPAGVQVLADPVALEQIVHNLLMNAMQALERAPAHDRRVVVRIERPQFAASATGDSPTGTTQDTAASGQVRLSVSDNGPGITAENLPHVFEPFFTTREGGLGLGLSLCETLALGMGGTLSASHAAPQGATFTLTLPLAPT